MKGKRGWRPAYLEDEINDIMREENIQREAMAMYKLVEHARVGRELNRLQKFDIAVWKKKRALPDLNQYGRRKHGFNK